MRQPPPMWLPNREFKRLHRPEMLSKTDWLIEQQIARYFSRLSALTKTGLLKRSPSVITRQKIRIQTKAAGLGTTAIRLQKIKTSASHFSFKFMVFAYENNWLCLGIFHKEEFAGSPPVKILLAHSLINFTSHAIKRQQHSIEGDVDLHVVIKCLKKKCR